jgi:lysophospholipase L1-like esterase
VIVVLALVALIYTKYPVQAESIPTDWSWANTDPITVHSTPVDNIAGMYCKGSYQSVEVSGKGTRWGCLQQGHGAMVGTYDEYANTRMLIKFTYDTKAYPVYAPGGCEKQNGCIYIPATDTLVTKQHNRNSIVRSLIIYKDFKKRLAKVVDSFGITIAYSFDATNPDYEFRSSDGTYWSVEGVGASNNGSWLAVEFRGRGIGILNMNTGEMKRLTTFSPEYGYGSDPGTLLAITNNGKHVAMAATYYGKSGAITLYDANTSCGDEASDRNMEFVIPVERPCKKFNFKSDAVIPRLLRVSSPRFNDEGGQLEFFAQSLGAESRSVTLHAPGYDPTQLDYLALGDSFSSGEGETDDTYYQPGTNDEFEKCHLSKRSYPYLIAASLGIEPQHVRSVACSGAVTGDVVGNEEGYWGQDGRLKNVTPSLNDVTKTVYQASAKQSFNPGRVHQIAFVEQSRPKVITIGIGGNDVGFMEKLKACVGLDSCEWAETAEGREKTAIEIRSVFDTLVSTYTALHDASPKSKIYVIGYPKVIDPSGQCGLVDGILLNTTERTFMNEGIVYINQIIAAAAQKVGVKYIDIQETFGNKVLCGSEKPSAMNAIRAGDDDSIIPILGWLKVIGKESFHPRPTGHTQVASVVVQSVPNMLAYDYCLTVFSRQNGTCPSSTVTAPSPSGYWLVDGVTHGYRAQHNAKFVDDSADTANIREKSITLPNYTFTASSSVQVEIHSNPVTLGSTTANSSGALSFNIELPADLEEGFHTIHLYGTSYSGQAVDLYQVITYQLPPVTLAEPTLVSSTHPEVVSNNQNNVATQNQITPNDTTASSSVFVTQPPTSLIDDTNGEVLASTSLSEPQLTSSSPIVGDSTLAAVPLGKKSDTISFSEFLIPGAVLLFVGTGFAFYMRLRRNR